MLPSVAMTTTDTEGELRDRVRRLVRLGVNQKVIAAKMGVSATWFSKWKNNKPNTSPLKVTAMDRYAKFAQELARTALGVPRDEQDPNLLRDLAEGLTGSHGAGPGPQSRARPAAARAQAETEAVEKRRAVSRR